MTADQVRVLLRTSLDEFDAPFATVSAIARRALRIAAHRRDLMHQLWIQWELTDLEPGKIHKTQDPAISKIMNQLTALLGAEEGTKQRRQAFLRYERTRTFQIDGEPKLYGHPIGQIEHNLATARAIYDDYPVPKNLIPVDAYVFARDQETSKAKMLPLIAQQEQLLDRIKSAIHSFLIETECELEEGQEASPLFQRAQEYINAALAKYAPDALQKFLAAQDRLYSGNPEDLAHALTSCRRMIKALADALYPATNETVRGGDGIERKMSDDAYRNRLLQYVREQLGTRIHGTVVQKSIDSLGGRLKSLDSLASKGVHDEVGTAEAETCVVWTYLLAGDIIRVADGTSAWLADD